MRNRYIVFTTLLAALTVVLAGCKGLKDALN